MIASTPDDLPILSKNQIHSILETDAESVCRLQGPSVWHTTVNSDHTVSEYYDSLIANAHLESTR